MTNTSSHTAAGGTSVTSDVVRRALEIAVGIALVAALAGAWLTFFSFVPFDLRIH